MKFKKQRFFLLVSLICLIAINQKAYAYLDPGTGSMIVQVIVASLATVGCFLYKAKENIILFFRKILNKKANVKENEDRKNDN